MGNGPDYLNKDRGQSKGPDYLGRDSGVDWRKHEDDVAKRSGGNKRAASGAAPGKPADTKDENFLREYKSTFGAGMSIKGEWLTKICSEALPLGKIPLMELRFDKQEAPTPTDWVLIPALDFEAILERIKSG